MPFSFESFEFSQECDADVYVMIRFRHDGQIVLFIPSKALPLSQEQLASSYPTPKEITWDELAAQYDKTKS
ncbi:uncharacterized protein AKAW2_21094A [Aspergillus luchuensis]|uniref:Uncharacterized protein n=1 Tax=Aspergillus kawachii TaxID=1069201 RepID=A0A7R7ZWT9_ASPKA|nr:uncharacterized protein AKAW2_21094A [Aspergillus luchuensis]BCR96154.1 hypothetical protein AKAW2_21094A [Aspergillus luchuensis]